MKKMGLETLLLLLLIAINAANLCSSAGSGNYESINTGLYESQVKESCHSLSVPQAYCTSNRKEKRSTDFPSVMQTYFWKDGNNYKVCSNLTSNSDADAGNQTSLDCYYDGELGMGKFESFGTVKYVESQDYKFQIEADSKSWAYFPSVFSNQKGLMSFIKHVDNTSIEIKMNPQEKKVTENYEVYLFSVEQGVNQGKEVGEISFKWPMWSKVGDPTGVCVYHQFENEMVFTPYVMLSAKFNASANTSEVAIWVESVTQLGVQACLASTNNASNMSNFSEIEGVFYYAAFTQDVNTKIQTIQQITLNSTLFNYWKTFRQDFELFKNEIATANTSGVIIDGNSIVTKEDKDRVIFTFNAELLDNKSWENTIAGFYTAQSIQDVIQHAYTSLGENFIKGAKSVCDKSVKEFGTIAIPNTYCAKVDEFTILENSFSCTSDKVYNSATKMCECFAHSIESEGVCSECKDTEYVVDGKCKECIKGSVYDSVTGFCTCNDTTKGWNVMSTSESSSCVTCPRNQFGFCCEAVDVKFDSNECRCKPGYFLNPDKISCTSKCSSKYVTENGKCTCNKNSFYDPVTKDCVNCDLSKFKDGDRCVSSCSNPNFYSFLNICMKECPKNAVVVDNTNKCECASGYHISGLTCVEEKNSVCAVLLNTPYGMVCSARCPSSTNLVDGECTCKHATEYFDTNTFECRNMTKFILSEPKEFVDNESRLFLLQCPFYHYPTGVCTEVCKNGYIAPQNFGEQCVCNGYYSSDGTCYNTCESFHFESNRLCTTNCSESINGEFLAEYQNPQGTTGACQCSTNYKKDEATNECVCDGKFQDGVCVSSCSKYYFEDEDTCTDNCPTKTGYTKPDSPSGACACAKGYIYENSKCVECNDYINNGQCVIECTDYYYDHNQECTADCSNVGYKKPTGKEKVCECDTGFESSTDGACRCPLYMNGESCVRECPNYYYPYSNVCTESCSEYGYKNPAEGIKACACQDYTHYYNIDKNECLTCDGYAEEGRCVQACSSNLKYHYKHNNVCTSNCMEEGYKVPSKGTECECAEYYYYNENNECKFCEGYLENGACQTNCIQNAYYYDHNRICVAECANEGYVNPSEPGRCACAVDYVFNAEKKCELCKDFYETGQCKNECSESNPYYHKFNQVCTNQCNNEEGYKNPESAGACACAENYSELDDKCVCYRQGSSCISECTDAYYYKHNLVCEDNCEDTKGYKNPESGQKQCTCAERYELDSNEQCIACSATDYYNIDKCTSACPANNVYHYKHNLVCTSECSTQTGYTNPESGNVCVCANQYKEKADSDPPNTCVICYTEGEECVFECEKYYYKHTSTCTEDCSTEGYKNPTGTEKACQCDTNFNKFGGNECKQCYYSASAESNCIAECSSSEQYHYDHNKRCASNCGSDPNYKNPADGSNVCICAADTFFMVNGECAAECPDSTSYYYGKSRTCTADCSTNSGYAVPDNVNEKKCICADGFNFDSDRDDGDCIRSGLRQLQNSECFSTNLVWTIDLLCTPSASYVNASECNDMSEQQIISTPITLNTTSFESTSDACGQVSTEDKECPVTVYNYFPCSNETISHFSSLAHIVPTEDGYTLVSVDNTTTIVIVVVVVVVVILVAVGVILYNRKKTS